MHFSGRQLLRMEGDATREIALCLLFGVQFLNADGHLHRIRHYGLFANGKNRAPNIARARQLLAVPQNTAQLNIDPNAESDQPRALPKPCPCCGGRLIIIEPSRVVANPSTLRQRSGSTPHDAVTLDQRLYRASLSQRSTGNACARAKPPILPADPPQTSPRNAPLASQSPYSPRSDRSNRFYPESLTQSPRLNPQSARGTAAASPTAISCLGAFDRRRSEREKKTSTPPCRAPNKSHVEFAGCSS